MKVRTELEAALKLRNDRELKHRLSGNEWSLLRNADAKSAKKDDKYRKLIRSSESASKKATHEKKVRQSMAKFIVEWEKTFQPMVRDRLQRSYVAAPVQQVLSRNHLYMCKQIIVMRCK